MTPTGRLVASALALALGSAPLAAGADVARAEAAPVAAHVAAPAISPAASPATSPIVIGEQLALDYAPGDTRQINVHLPEGYATGTARYPVLYVIDGGLSQDFLHVVGASELDAAWQRSAPAIVVGIESKDRRAELIGSKGNAEQRKAYPTAGDSARFRAFLRDRVKPLVAARYRTSGTDAVIGESLAGLFIVETWLAEPDLFTRYAAIDPSLWWQDGALANSAAATLADGRARGGLYLSTSNEGPENDAAVATFVQSAGQRACLTARPDLTHATAYHTLETQALQFLFPTKAEHDAEWGFTVPCGAAG